MLDLSKNHFASLLGMVESLQGKDAERQRAITALEGKLKSYEQKESKLKAEMEAMKRGLDDLLTFSP